MTLNDRPRQDNHAPSPNQRRLADDFVMGMRFFSRLPVGDAAHVAPSLNRMAPALPFVSFAIGALPALILMGLCWMTAPPLVAATIAIGVLALLTGAMAEDALADAADGLGGGANIERRLEIMTDSRHGTYGVLAIVLFAVLRISALGAVATVSPLAAGALLLASGVLARSGALWLAVVLYPAREGGAAASAGRPDMRSYFLGLAFAVPLAFILAGPFVGVVGLVVAAVVAVGVIAGWVALCRRLVGGQTGDLIGALQALVEMAVLAVFVIFA